MGTSPDGNPLDVNKMNFSCSEIKLLWDWACKNLSLNIFSEHLQVCEAGRQLKSISHFVFFVILVAALERTCGYHVPNVRTSSCAVHRTVEVKSTHTRWTALTRVQDVSHLKKTHADADRNYLPPARICRGLTSSSETGWWAVKPFKIRHAYFHLSRGQVNALDCCRTCLGSPFLRYRHPPHLTCKHPMAPIDTFKDWTQWLFLGEKSCSRCES